MRLQVRRQHRLGRQRFTALRHVAVERLQDAVRVFQVIAQRLQTGVHRGAVAVAAAVPPFTNLTAEQFAFWQVWNGRAREF